VFSALEVCYDNVLYKFTFDIDIDIMSQHSALVIIFDVFCVIFIRYVVNKMHMNYVKENTVNNKPKRI